MIAFFIENFYYLLFYRVINIQIFRFCFISAKIRYFLSEHISFIGWKHSRFDRLLLFLQMKLQKLINLKSLQMWKSNAEVVLRYSTFSQQSKIHNIISTNYFKIYNCSWMYIVTLFFFFCCILYHALFLVLLQEIINTTNENELNNKLF